MSEPIQPDPVPTPEDTARGKAYFNELLPRYRDLAPHNLVATTTAIDRAALTAVGVAARSLEQPLYDRFKSLPASEFDIANVNDLPKVAWATWYAAIEAKKTRALGSEAQLPADLVARAVDIEARMQRCCEYYFEDDLELGTYIAFLRGGNGHRDIAQDLLGYASIYVDRHAIVKDDKKNFRSTDAEDAVKVAEEMLSILGSGLTPEAKLASDNLTRAFTVLVDVYNEVMETGRWLERKNPNASKLFPSIYAAGRRKPRARSPKDSSSAG